MSRGERFVQDVWERRGAAGRAGYLLLRPLSEVFGAVVVLRDLAYRTGLFRVHRARLPVVSVGNLSVGGTGKTPLALWLGRRLMEKGVRAGILLRGYGGGASGPTIVSRGDGPCIGPEEAGDEAVMLAHAFPGPVVVAARRRDGAAVMEDLDCDLIVLDDGFQHRAIARSYDIVLLDGRTGPLLPAGPLRERASALRRADAVVLVERKDGGVPPQLPSAGAGKLVCRMRMEPSALVEVAGGRWVEKPIGHLAGSRVVAVAGIARPQAFYELIRRWEAEIIDYFEFGDHHPYAASDWQAIARAAREADLVVTTEKDLVKLGAFPFATGKLVALRIVPQVEKGDQLIEAILGRVAAHSAERRF